MEILNVCDLKKSFGKTEVLRGISFSMQEGEVLSIIGSSGSGKTTLLRCLTSLEKADKSTMDAIAEKIKNLQSVYDQRKERYWKQFNAMEQVIGNMSSTSSYLTSMMGY